ncbi:ABC transporter permease subunit [Dyadobacter sp. 32]|uniref:ABC transporter permease subunit n=1 Tax=Dyadobacter sp. 32 TaxID=538966 RepID=UPI0011ED5D6B
MKAVIYIVKKEFKEFSRSAVLLVCAFALAFCLTASLVISFSQYNQLRREHQQAGERARQAWLNQGEKGPHGAGHTGTVLFKPIMPLFALENGLYNYTGRWVELQTHTQHEVGKRPANDQTFLIRSGVFTPAFILQYLIPLFIIFLCYSAVTAEREYGTLRLLLSQQISARAILTGKVFAGAAKVGITILPLYAILSIVFWILPEFGLQAWVRMNLMFLFYIAYYFILILFCIIISVWSKTSSRSLAVLTGFWIITSIVAPRVFVSLSESIAATPSNFEMKVAFDKGQGNSYVLGYKGFDTFNKIYGQITDSLMKAEGVSTVDSLKVNPFGFAIEHTEEAGQRINDESYGVINRNFDRQIRIQRFAGIISPLSAIRFLSMSIAGTGLEEHDEFVRQAEQYRRTMMKKLNLNIAYHSDASGYDLKKRSAKGKDYVQGRDLWQQIPAFNYSPVPLASVLKNNTNDILIIFGWFVAGIAIFLKTARRLTI